MLIRHDRHAPGVKRREFVVLNCRRTLPVRPPLLLSVCKISDTGIENPL
jgi:hypothetical protein